MRIFRIANPTLSAGGGGARSYKVLEKLSQLKDVEIVLVPPLNAICKQNLNNINELRKNKKIIIPEEVYEFSKNCKYTKNPIKILNNEITYYSHFEKYAKESDVIFCDHEGYSLVASISILKRKTSLPTVLLNQAGNLIELNNLRWNLKVRGFKLLTILKYLRFKYTNEIFRKYGKDVDLLLSFSKAGINEMISLKLVRKDVKWGVLTPGNAVDENLLSEANLDKEDYAIFFARLIPEKGIFELPKIWKKVRESIPNAKLVVVGKFFNDSIKKKFLKIIRNSGIEYKGYVSREELVKLVSKAKVVVYPTHFDNFPLVILESLSLKTAVVSYDLAPLKEIYNNIKAIKFVKEFNIKEFADKIVEILKMNDEDYEGLFDNKAYHDFIELHTSWEKVSLAEYSILKTFLQK